MPVEMGKAVDELKNRGREIIVRDNSIDLQEKKEREEAAGRYAVENEKHLVDYINDCIKTSVDAKKEIRAMQDYCYKIFNEEEPASYAKKEAWQSRIVVPRPFDAVMYGASAIKKAFSPEFLSVSDSKDKFAGEFWKKTLENQTNNLHANFPLRFADSVVMAMAIGESMDMIPVFTPGIGLKFDLVEPWKIHRDPDAPSRDSQGGLYWIHQEWTDWHVLRQGEETGRYKNVGRAKDVYEDSTDSSDPFMTKEAIALRKKQIWTRSNFRTMLLVSEFWGTILSPNGEMLLPRATYTMAGNRIIAAPKAVRYNRLRWPGISFSPLPDILAFGGRGLLKGIRTVWESMCNMMCLHEDAMKWVVNPPIEIEVSRLDDPEDVEDWPGKKYLVNESLHGNPAIRPVNRRDNTNTILANMQYLDQLFQRGSFVTDVVQGLPGYRKDMTFRESAQMLDQSMGVYALMGANIEDGAVGAVDAAQDVIETYAGFRDYEDIFDWGTLQQLGIRADPEAPNGVSGVPGMSGSFHISGITAMMQDNETMQNLQSLIIPLAEKGRFARYMRPYQILKAVESRINLTDENVIVDEDMAKQIEATEMEMMSRADESAENAEEIQEVGAVADILERLGRLEEGERRD